jgi:hypothetical protein
MAWASSSGTKPALAIETASDTRHHATTIADRGPPTSIAVLPLSPADMSDENLGMHVAVTHGHRRGKQLGRRARGTETAPDEYVVVLIAGGTNPLYLLQ